MEEGLDKQESLWLQMLESILTKKIDQSGNVILLGNPKTGKKQIIKLMQELVHQETPQNKSNDFEDLDKIYIMDFKYIKMKNQEDENDFHDHGKINFHIINKKYRFMDEFWNREMFKNLIIIIVIDLDDAQNMEKNLNEWLSFIYASIKNSLNEIDPVTRKKIFFNFQKTIHLLKALNPANVKLYQEFKNSTSLEVEMNPKNIAKPKEYTITEIREVDENEDEKQHMTVNRETSAEELADSNIQEPNKNDQKGFTLNQVKTKEQEVELNDENEFDEGEDEDEEKEKESETGERIFDIDNFKLPLLIMGSKSDRLDSINDEKLLKYIQFNLRKLAVENEAFLMTTSSFQERNIKNLLDLLFYSLLEKTDEINKKNLETNLILNKLFIPPGTDNKVNLNANFGFEKYEFPQKNKKGEKLDEASQNNKMSMIQDFFKDLNTGVMKFSNNEVPYSTRNINYNYNNTTPRTTTNQSSNGTAKTRTSPINTLRIQDILNRRND